MGSRSLARLVIDVISQTKENRMSAEVVGKTSDWPFRYSIFELRSWMACQLLSEPRKIEAGKSIIRPPLHIRDAGCRMHLREKPEAHEAPAGCSRNSGSWKMAAEEK